MVCCSIIPFISRFNSVRLSVNGTLLDPYGEVLASEFLPMAAFNNLMTSQKNTTVITTEGEYASRSKSNTLHIYTISKYNTRYRRITYFTMDCRTSYCHLQCVPASIHIISITNTAATESANHITSDCSCLIFLLLFFFFFFLPFCCHSRCSCCFCFKKITLNSSAPSRWGFIHLWRQPTISHLRVVMRISSAPTNQTQAPGASRKSSQPNIWFNICVKRKQSLKLQKYVCSYYTYI